MFWTHGSLSASMGKKPNLHFQIPRVSYYCHVLTHQSRSCTVLYWDVEKWASPHSGYLGSLTILGPTSHRHVARCDSLWQRSYFPLCFPLLFFFVKEVPGRCQDNVIDAMLWSLAGIEYKLKWEIWKIEPDDSIVTPIMSEFQLRHSRGVAGSLCGI